MDNNSSLFDKRTNMHPNHPDLRSFIEVKQHSDFPIQNLPYGAFSNSKFSIPQIGIAIGEYILNLSALERDGIIKTSTDIFQSGTLNKFMDYTPDFWREIREKVSQLLRHDNPILQKDFANIGQSKYFEAQDKVQMHLPAYIGDYTDFYSSKEHASNIGSMFRDKNNPLLPNWLHLPIGYHGRSSSIVISQTAVTRPSGQVFVEGSDGPIVTASQRLDFELEMAFFVGKGNRLGIPLAIEKAEDSIFGLVLLNDWSARDIQKWEYVPLGPFISKSFATSISPWIVSLEALEPFRTSGPKQDPEPLDYLKNPAEKTHHNLNLEVLLKTENLTTPVCLCKTNTKYLYWSMAQQLAHHTKTGCNLRSGDLLASGTISGADRSAYGSLVEISWGGKDPFILPNGEKRSFLLDGDEVIMRAWGEGKGYRIGFGEVRGKILPAHTTSV